MKRCLLASALCLYLLTGFSQQNKTTVDSITVLMEKHIEICNETDTARRNITMKEVYAENIYSVDPGGAVNGHAGVIEAIEGLHKTLPGCILTITGKVDSHHNVARFPYSLGKPGEKPVAKGWDIVVFQQGKITHIYTFVDK